MFQKFALKNIRPFITQLWNTAFTTSGLGDFDTCTQGQTIIRMARIFYPHKTTDHIDNCS